MTLVIDLVSFVLYRYVNNAPQFSDATRIISFHVNDGIFNSTPVFAYVSLLEMNDAPVLRLNGSVSDVDLIYTEGQSQPLLLAINATITGLCTYSSMYQDLHSLLQGIYTYCLVCVCKIR